ncbi:hypothetical protein OJ997_07365 [Solirubrobacter phytolaccae]|uniref:Uncharacterized protein n=1 Tax=Solirubrobacter phytolaccae TaxID=1404360 RepID=A0A9X3SAA1_9ACTN|nr:hypothetical protein [Solirubrobacter phytolaccae]MDA0180110.1 hypothetical protein [Solirubrobacter phytolaccae]
MSSLSAASLPSPDPKPVITALGTFTAAVIVVLTAFAIVDWSAAQTAFVTAEAAALLGFLAALLSHLKPGTAKENVALAGTITALVSSTLALGTGFGWWSLTQDQAGALLGTVTAIIGVAAAMIAREHMTADTTPGTE